MSNSIENKLSEISSSLDELKSLIILLSQKELDIQKDKLLPRDSIKRQIYELCDGDNSISEIANKIQKDAGYVSSNLSRLKREGLVRKIERNDEVFYEQIF